MFYCAGGIWGTRGGPWVACSRPSGRQSMSCEQRRARARARKGGRQQACQESAVGGGDMYACEHPRARGWRGVKEAATHARGQETRVSCSRKRGAAQASFMKSGGEGRVPAARALNRRSGQPRPCGPHAGVRRGQRPAAHTNGTCGGSVSSSTLPPSQTRLCKGCPSGRGKGGQRNRRRMYTEIQGPCRASA